MRDSRRDSRRRSGGAVERCGVHPRLGPAWVGAARLRMVPALCRRPPVKSAKSATEWIFFIVITLHAFATISPHDKASPHISRSTTRPNSCHCGWCRHRPRVLVRAVGSSQSVRTREASPQARRGSPRRRSPARTTRETSRDRPRRPPRAMLPPGATLTACRRSHGFGDSSDTRHRQPQSLARGRAHDDPFRARAPPAQQDTRRERGSPSRIIRWSTAVTDRWG